ncbi:MAG: TolC family protein [Armatimonadetes bacterium]|nr:TolC family protein [Armatimonadota bacterium]
MHPARSGRRAACLAVLLACALPAQAEQAPAPPVAPNVQEAPLPPPVELPAPDSRPDDVPDRPLTAAEAAAIALRYHANVTAAQAGVVGAQARVRQAQAALRPTAGIGAGYTRSDRVVSGGGSGGSGGSGSSSPGYSASATLRQLLFDRQHSRDLVRQAAAQERGATESLSRVEADLVLQVKQAFYTYLQNTRLVAVNEANLRSRREHLALAEARLKAGVGLPLDVVRAKTAVSEAVLALTTARNNASTARVSLAALMGLDPRTPIQVAESSEPEVKEEDVNALIESALKQRPEVRQAEAAVEASRYAVSAARTTNAPALSASAGLSSRGADLSGIGTSVTLGLQLQWTPFDGGVAAGRMAEAQAGAETAEAQLRNIQQQVVAEVSQAYLNLRTAEQRVATAEDGIANAEESLRLASGRYRAGVGIFLDVLDAQAALLTAQTTHINAVAAVAQARAALSRALGAPVRP